MARIRRQLGLARSGGDVPQKSRTSIQQSAVNARRRCGAGDTRPPRPRAAKCACFLMSRPGFSFPAFPAFRTNARRSGRDHVLHPDHHHTITYIRMSQPGPHVNAGVRQLLSVTPMDTGPSALPLLTRCTSQTPIRLLPRSSSPPAHLSPAHTHASVLHQYRTAVLGTD
jgi:hypothetical protein